MTQRLRKICFDLALIALAVVASSSHGFAVELLTDGGFEDSHEVDEAGGQWTWVYGFLPKPTVNATTNPLSGLQNAELMLDTTQLFTAFGPTMRSTVYAGSGIASGVTDFTGLSLNLTTNYKVSAFNMHSPDPNTPAAVVVRTYLAYFSKDFGFLGYGGLEGDPQLSDAYPTAITPDYQTQQYGTVVPNFGTPVTSVDFTIGLIAPSADNGSQMTGTATVDFDNVSLTAVVPLSTDLNKNGIVDAADYTVWRNSLGATGITPFTKGDANGDGTVDQTDYNLWRSQFGLTSGAGAGGFSGGAVGVPEPSCVSMISIGTLLLMSRRLRPVQVGSGIFFSSVGWK